MTEMKWMEMPVNGVSKTDQDDLFQFREECQQVQTQGEMQISSQLRHMRPGPLNLETPVKQQSAAAYH